MRGEAPIPLSSSVEIKWDVDLDGKTYRLATWRRHSVVNVSQTRNRHQSNRRRRPKSKKRPVQIQSLDRQFVTRSRHSCSAPKDSPAPSGIKKPPLLVLRDVPGNVRNCGSDPESRITQSRPDIRVVTPIFNRPLPGLTRSATVTPRCLTGISGELHLSLMQRTTNGLGNGVRPPPNVSVNQIPILLQFLAGECISSLTQPHSRAGRHSVLGSHL
ncbi:hypothetical protein VTK26DRAFT_7086 [Humicola hyalothermophila]